jgi:hypothetical protein
MFRRRHDPIDLLREAHASEVKQLLRLVDALAEQVEYLRGQLGAPNLLKRPAVNPSALPDIEPGFRPSLSEEEEDLRHMAAEGLMNERELEEALALAGLKSTAIQFD